MIETSTFVESNDLNAEALEHCIFPLIQMDEVRRDGPKIYVSGEGVRLTDAEGREYLDMMSSHTRANSLGYGNAEIAGVRIAGNNGEGADRRDSWMDVSHRSCSSRRSSVHRCTPRQCMIADSHCRGW